MVAPAAAYEDKAIPILIRIVKVMGIVNNLN